MTDIMTECPNCGRTSRCERWCTYRGRWTAVDHAAWRTFIRRDLRRMTRDIWAERRPGAL